MEYAILRIAKRTTASSVAGMARHALRETVVPNAEKGAPRPVVLAGEPNTPAVMAKLRAAVEAAPRRRADMVRALDVLVTASPSAMQRMTRSQQDDYFARALRFIESRFGGAANVLTAAVHRDETTPHMQVLLMPRAADGSFQASKMVGNKAALSALQDGFWEACGRPHKLDRGERRTGAQHVTIRQFYSSMEAGEDPPRPVRVPPEPEPLGPFDRLSSTKRAEHAAAVAARAKALAHNQRERERLQQQAEAGRRMHPAAVARQAQRYRDAQRLAAVAEKAQEEAREALSGAHEQRRAAQREVKHAEAVHAAAEGLLMRHDGAKLIAAFTRAMRPELVARLAQLNGVELVAGRDVIDQLRRAGKCRGLADGAKLVASQIDGIEAAALAHHRAQQGQRPREEPERPRPRG